MYRGALDLLSTYGDISSDEEVPIGRVSTKRCFKSDEDSNRKRIKLPLPQEISNVNHNMEDVPIDEPTLHGGRTRSFPHERGNWVSYVYIPYDPPDTAMEEIINGIVNNLHHLGLQTVDHFHISLTKTIILRHHWIESFVQSIREKVCLMKKFIILFNSLNVYCNEERTRTFIGVEIKSGYDTLVHLVKHLDVCLSEFRLPQFYENPSFHMSLVWCVGDHEEEIREVLPQLSSYVEKVLNNYGQNSWLNYVTHLECKSGNKLFRYNLS